MSELRFDHPVMLMGGGGVDAGAALAAARHAGAVVAADGGVEEYESHDDLPPLKAVIGDMDSVRDLERWRAWPGCHVALIEEQDTTDLEKCLYSTVAPLYLGVGFLGRRFDHTLAACHTLLKYADRRVILIGEEDVIFLSPRIWRAALAPGARVSLFPLGPSRALRSEGLRWPLRELDLAVGGRIGTSNMAEAEEVMVEFDAMGAAVILGREHLDAAIASLGIEGLGVESLEPAS